MNTPANARTNDQWLAQLRRREGDAVADLRTYLSRVLARILRRVDGVDREDVTQDALLRILQNLDRFRGDCRFTTWATAVAVRVGLGSLQRRRPSPRSLDEVGLGPRTSPDPEPGHAMGKRKLLETLRRAIDESLSERQRTAILGRLGSVPSSQLAERLGTNRNALYKLYFDARTKLRQALHEAGYSDEDVRLELQGASRTA